MGSLNSCTSKSGWRFSSKYVLDVSLYIIQPVSHLSSQTLRCNYWDSPCKLLPINTDPLQESLVALQDGYTCTKCAQANSGWMIYKYTSRTYLLLNLHLIIVIKFRLLEWRHRCKTYMFVITNWLILRKYPFITWQLIFCLWCRFLSFLYPQQEFYRTWQNKYHFGCHIRIMNCSFCAWIWVLPGGFRVARLLSFVLGFFMFSLSLFCALFPLILVSLDCEFLFALRFWAYLIPETRHAHGLYMIAKINQGQLCVRKVNLSFDKITLIRNYKFQ
jgi:hypothetical protein